MRKWLLRILYVALVMLPVGAIANYAMTVGSGTNFGSVVIGGVHFASSLICDFTTANQCASVKAASTAPVATDPAIVVTLSQNAGLGAAATPVQVSLANTAANGTAVKVDGSAVTQPVSSATLSTAANQTSQITQETAINTVLGLGTDAACAGDNTSGCTVEQRLQRIAQNLTTVNTSVGASIPVGTNNIGNVGSVLSASTTLQNAAVANGPGTDLETEAAGGAVLHVVCSVACSGGTTINFEASFDGTTYVPIQGTPVGGGAPTTTATTTGDFAFNVSGYSDLHARISAYSAGTITVTGFTATSPSLQPGTIPVTLGVNQSVNVAQFGGVSTSTGQVATSVAPVTATNTALVVDLRPDSPGIIALGTNTAANSVPVVLNTTPTIANGNGVLIAPTAGATASPTVVACGSAVSSCVLKNAAGNLYDVYAECTSACWLMVFASASAPANGATTAGVATTNMQHCVAISAGGTGSIVNGPIPEAFVTGITAVVSSTACASLTLSTVGFIHGRVQ